MGGLMNLTTWWKSLSGCRYIDSLFYERGKEGIFERLYRVELGHCEFTRALGDCTVNCVHQRCDRTISAVESFAGTAKFDSAIVVVIYELNLRSPARLKQCKNHIVAAMRPLESRKESKRLFEGMSCYKLNLYTIRPPSHLRKCSHWIKLTMLFNVCTNQEESPSKRGHLF